MGETWARGGAAGDGDEAGIRGLGLAESLGDSVAPDARRLTAGCPAGIGSLPLDVEEDKSDFA
jgi:hypothetical protein